MERAVADATREILASADAVIDRVRSRIDGDVQPVASDDTATAFRVADEWNDRVEQLVRERHLAYAAKHFRAQWPALIRWRESVLKNARKSKPAVVAAAFESLALECTLAGELDLAAKAQQAAVDVMRRRGMARIETTVVPIRSDVPASGEQAQSA